MSELSSLPKLLTQLDLESTGVDVFRGDGHGGSRRRMFGGHVAGQSLMAAGRTVEGLAAHSLHAFFLRPGDPNLPIEFRVDRLRDGRSFATRTVVASQNDEAILQAAISFHVAESGFEHQVSAPSVPPPAACMTWEEWVAPRLAQLSEERRQDLSRDRPIDIRPIDPVDSASPTPAGFDQKFWCRTRAALPDDALLHQCIATYTSDHTLLSCVMRPHAQTFMSPGVMAASLDHTIWFHRAFRMDQWLLYSQHSPVAHAARGLSFGHFFDEQGVLVASVAQEGLIRQRRD
jgi:acyl-CoA thioesterase-2